MSEKASKAGAVSVRSGQRQRDPHRTGADAGQAIGYEGNGGGDISTGTVTVGLQPPPMPVRRRRPEEFTAEEVRQKPGLFLWHHPGAVQKRRSCPRHNGDWTDGFHGESPANR